MMSRLSSREIDARFEELRTYWESIRIGNNIPLRTNFNPVKFKRLLPNITISEYQSRDVIIDRLVGTANVERRGGFNSTGLNIVEYMPEETRPILTKTADLIINTPCGTESNWIVQNADGKLVSVIGIYLPITGSDEHPHCILMVSYEKGVDGYEQEPTRNLLGLAPKIRYIDIGFGVPDEG
jgi:hypothetical protein